MAFDPDEEQNPAEHLKSPLFVWICLHRLCGDGASGWPSGRFSGFIWV